MGASAVPLTSSRHPDALHAPLLRFASSLLCLASSLAVPCMSYSLPLSLAAPHHALGTQAVALGAKAVGIGRPVIYSLAAFGQDGVEKMLQLLKALRCVPMYAKTMHPCPLL